MKKLYLMRHGETLFNSLGKIQGACDSPLTEKGIKQAEMAKDYFESNKITFDGLYSSTQERASDTLEIIIGNRPYSREKGLKEWNFGIFEGESEKLNPKRPEGETSFANFFVPYGGEAATAVQDRMVKSLTDIMNKDENNSVLATSHGGAMYLFIQKWLPFEEVSNIKFGNCCILEFLFDDNEFMFQQAIAHDFSSINE